MRQSLALLLFGCIGLSASPLPTDSPSWYRDPLQWRLQDGVWHVQGNASSLNVCEALPVCRQAQISGVVQADKNNSESWSVAGIALVADRDNFWHIALVQAPEKSGSRRYFEVCEMLNGQWLAQNSLKVEFSEEPGTWEPNQPVRLNLKLDPTGIEGRAEALDGTLLFRRRFAFSGEAVTTGRPGIRAGGFTAEYRDLAFTGTDPVEQVATAQAPVVPYTCTSFVPDMRGKATGFFRTEQRDGVWWVFDPLGRGFVPLGIDHVRYSGSWCEKLGYAPHGRKNDAKFANQEEWAEQTLDRLTTWGFNLLTASYDNRLLHRGLAHTGGMNVGNSMALLGDEFDITPNERRPCSAFPNVFHPDFAAFCQFRARNVCTPQANDPWLFGYFLDNELAWWGRGALDTGLFDATMKKGATHTAKLGLREVLKRHFGNDLAACNRAFGTDLASFDAVLELDALPTPTPEARAAKHAFLAECAERYFGTLAAAIHAADPNHMILGARFAGGRVDPVVWEAAGRYSEILTFNYYGSVDLDRKVALADGPITKAGPLHEPFAEFYRLGGNRPMMVTEWSFPALDSGLPCTKGAGQRFRTQAERTEASDIFARSILSQPYMVGYDYFMWVDQPALGISTAFPENSDYGITNEEGVPYPGLVRVLSQINLKDAPAIHRTGQTGIAAPVAGQGLQIPAAPKGTEWVLWNRTDATIPAGPVPMPMGKAVPFGTGGFVSWLAWQDGQWRGLPGRSQGVLAYTPAIPAQGVLYLKRSREGSPESGPVDLQYSRNGNGWQASCGKWKLAGAIAEGPFVSSVSYDSIELGHYSGMVQQFAGANRWNETNFVTDVQASESSMGLVLTFTGEFRPEEGDTAQGFRLVHRLAFPAGADYFVAQCLEATDLGSEPLNLRALFFRFHGAIGGSAEGDVPGDMVPRLWKAAPQNAWYDEQANAFFGATAPADSRASIRFWLNDKGGQHPDAKIEYELEIAPGATFVPPEPAVVYGFAGKGADWQSVAARVAARQAFYRPTEFQP